MLTEWLVVAWKRSSHRRKLEKVMIKFLRTICECFRDFLKLLSLMS